MKKLEKISEKGITNLKKIRKRKKTFKKEKKEKRERERSFLNGNAFPSFLVLASFNLHNIHYKRMCIEYLMHMRSH